MSGKASQVLTKMCRKKTREEGLQNTPNPHPDDKRRPHFIPDAECVGREASSVALPPAPQTDYALARRAWREAWEKLVMPPLV